MSNVINIKKTIDIDIIVLYTINNLGNAKYNLNKEDVMSYKKINVEYINTGTLVLDEDCALDETWVLKCNHENGLEVSYNKYDDEMEVSCDFCWDLTEEEIYNALIEYTAEGDESYKEEEL